MLVQPRIILYSHLIEIRKVLYKVLRLLDCLGWRELHLFPFEDFSVLLVSRLVEVSFLLQFWQSQINAPFTIAA